MRVYLRLIVKRDDGICLQTDASAWIPLNGDLPVSRRFRQLYGRPQRGDIGRKLYMVNGDLRMLR